MFRERFRYDKQRKGIGMSNTHTRYPRVCHSESAHESETFFGATGAPRNPSPPRRKFLLLFVAFLTLLCYYWSRTKAFGISERLFLLLKYTLTSINN